MISYMYHVFGFDVILVILIGFCLMLSPLLCVLVQPTIFFFKNVLYQVRKMAIVIS